jgi:hypothetical protein
MRQSHSTITPAAVRCLAHAALQAVLPWRPFRRLVQVATLLDLLLLAATLASSLSAIVRRFAFPFSHETARQAVAANLPGTVPLTAGLVDALWLFSARTLRRRRWVLAIDEHRDPFYGDRTTAGISGGQKKHGTKYAYAYATAVIVHRRHRWTVGLLARSTAEKPHEVVAALLEQVQRWGLRVRGVVLDSGFDSGETLLLLQGRAYSYTVPLQRKGSSSNRRNALWQLAVGTVTTVAWQTDKSRRAVSTQAVVVQRPGEKEKKVYAFGGWQASQALGCARLARRWYRARFGIETSYRQMRQGKAKTSAKEVGYRLLLVGLGLLLRQVWVYLTGQIARARKLRPKEWVEELPLARLLNWLAERLQSKYKEDKVIHLGSPLPPLTTAGS